MSKSKKKFGKAEKMTVNSVASFQIRVMLQAIARITLYGITVKS